jgi:hypothetical protein
LSEGKEKSPQTVIKLSNEFQPQHKRFTSIFLLKLLVSPQKSRAVLNYLENFLHDQDICQNLPASLNDSVPQFSLSIMPKLSLVIQRDSDQHLNDSAAANFRQRVNVAQGSSGQGGPLTFGFSSVSAFDQLSAKDALQVAKVIQKEAVWPTIDKYLMTASS